MFLPDGKPLPFHPVRFISGVLEVRWRVQEDVCDDDEEGAGM